MKKNGICILLVFASIHLLSGSLYSQPGEKIKNLGAIINTEGEEFSPSVSLDGKTLLFSMKKKGSKQSDIYISAMKEGKWSDPAPMDIINSDRDDESPFISFDDSMIVFSSNREGSAKPADFKGDDSGLPHDIYISFKIGSEWSKPEKVSDNINTAGNERAPSLDQGNNVLYFTRWPGNDMDKAKIMMVQLTEDGFSAAVELETPINTGTASYGFMPSKYREGFYFSSKRSGGFGSWDLYFIYLKSGKFSGAINLGPEINTESDELIVSEFDRNTIYFTSNRQSGIGLYDIYSSLIASEFTDTTVSDKKDSGRDNKAGSGDKQENGFNFKFVSDGTQKPLSVKLKLTVKRTKDGVSDPEKTIKGESGKDGIYTFIPEQSVTSVIVETTGSNIEPYNKEFQLEGGKIADITIGLKEKIKENTGFIAFDPGDFKPIYFANNSSEINVKDIPYIYDIINYMRKNKNHRLKIIGHSGVSPYCDKNEKISMKRAVSVRNFIISFGIDKNRIIIKSYGKKYPVDDKFNELNRRVEFVLLN